MPESTHETASGATRRARYAPLVETCAGFVVASPPDTGAAETGLGLRLEHRFDPRRAGSSRFLTLLQRLNALTWEPVGMPMPRWALYDCAGLPGAVFGLTRPAHLLPPWVCALMEVDPASADPVPLSAVVVIPMLPNGAWHTYALSSINEAAPGAAPVGLRGVTLALALAAVGADTAYAAVRWRSHALRAYARFGPLELLTAWTPAHTEAGTLTCRFPVSTARIGRALDVAWPRADDAALEFVDCDDERSLRAVQERLEEGYRLEVVGPPRIDGARVIAPLREISS